VGKDGVDWIGLVHGK